MAYPLIFRRLMRDAVVVACSVAAMLSALIVSADMVELLRKTDGTSGFFTLITLAVWRLPMLLQDMLPFVALVMAMVVLSLWQRGRQLVAVRAVGLGVWHIVLPLAAVAAVIGALPFMGLNPLAVQGMVAVEAWEQQHSQTRLPTTQTIVPVTPDPLWLQQPDAGGGYAIIRADRAMVQQPLLQGVNVWRFHANGLLWQRLDAPSMRLQPGVWQLTSATTTDGYALPRPVTLTLPTRMTANEFHQRFTDPDMVSLWALPEVIRRLITNGLPFRAYGVHWYDMLTQPVRMVSMVLLAAACCLQTTRRTLLAARMGMAMALGLLVYVLHHVLLVSTTAGHMPMLLGVLVIPMVAMSGCLAVLFRYEDPA